MSRFLLDGLNVRVKESVESNTITKLRMDHKYFEKIRNFGQALVHEEAGVVIEFFDQSNKNFHPKANSLKTYHKPEYVYSLKNRKTSWVFTYEVAYAISKAFPYEPFKNLDDELVYSWPVRVFNKEEKVVQTVYKESHKSGQKPKSLSLEADGILLNKTHSAILSSMESYDTIAVRDFHRDCMGFYYFQKYAEDQGPVYQHWKNVFSKKVMLYLGFRATLSQGEIDYCRSLNIRPLNWQKDRSVLL